MRRKRKQLPLRSTARLLASIERCTGNESSRQRFLSSLWDLQALAVYAWFRPCQYESFPNIFLLTCERWGFKMQAFGTSDVSLFPSHSSK